MTIRSFMFSISSFARTIMSIRFRAFYYNEKLVHVYVQIKVNCIILLLTKKNAYIQTNYNKKKIKRIKIAQEKPVQITRQFS